MGGGRTTRAACGGWICFEDEAGFTRRPPTGRTWGRRGITAVVKVNGRGSGRVSVAGLIAMRPGSRTRLCHRRRSLSERDYIALVDLVHQLVKAPIVLVWDPLNKITRRARAQPTQAPPVPSRRPRRLPRRDRTRHRPPAAITLKRLVS
ncbi:hypothetical protein ADL12_37820 [Streptomyces regalis]|uniref:Tc1-like transposase DDE domain-containing protein n=1 Tax=Streptomyces regalis TaxID=68262 RepID=A0A101JCE4_9ACTN|nr:hypothetical protein ADL12_37820 [Streptomyces regalis]